MLEITDSVKKDLGGEDRRPEPYFLLFLKLNKEQRSQSTFLSLFPRYCNEDNNICHLTS